VRLRAPVTPLSLARAVGISSAAFSSYASKVGIAGVAAGAKLNPQMNLWPVTSDRHPGPKPAMTFQLGDGSNLDNTGLIAALQRGAQKVVAVVNNETPLPSGAGFCDATPNLAMLGEVNGDLMDKFGYSRESRFGFYKNNQVFAKSELLPLLCEFTMLRAAGKPLVVRRRLDVQANTWWGLSGGSAVEVLFAMLDKSETFEALLPEETQQELLKDAEASEFHDFPKLQTIFENSDLTALTRAQVNLLAAQAEYAVSTNAELFNAFLAI